MNRWIAAAALLSAGLFFLHIIGGGVTVHAPILQGDISTLLKAYVSILWHGVTIILLINTVALFIAAGNKASRRTIVALVACEYAAFAGLFVFYGLDRLGTPFEMPQWTLFLAIAGLATMGLRTSSQPEGPMRSTA